MLLFAFDVNSAFRSLTVSLNYAGPEKRLRGVLISSTRSFDFARISIGESYSWLVLLSLFLCMCHLVGSSLRVRFLLFVSCLVRAPFLQGLLLVCDFHRVRNLIYGMRWFLRAPYEVQSNSSVVDSHWMANLLVDSFRFALRFVSRVWLYYNFQHDRKVLVAVLLVVRFR